MKKIPSPQPSPVNGRGSSNVHLLFGFILSLLPICLAFVPDEKLIRLKLLCLESGVFLWLSVALLFAIWQQRKPKLSWLSTSVFIWAGCSLVLWCVADDKALATQELRRVALGLGCFLCVWSYPPPALSRKLFFTMWALSGGLISLYGILQKSGGLGPIQVPQSDRIMGTFGNPIFFASYLVVTFFLTAHALTLTKQKSLRLLLQLCSLLNGIALYFTSTRAAWMGFFGSMVVLVLLTGSKRSILAILAAFSAFVFFTSSVWFRDQGHLLIWRDALKMWKDHPFLGVGLGAFHVHFPSYAGADLVQKWPQGHVIVNFAHNEYLQTLVEGGVLGLAGFLAIVVSFVTAFKKRLQENQTGSIFLATAVCAIFIQAFFSVEMRFSITTGFLFLLLGFVDQSGAVSDGPNANSSQNVRGKQIVLSLVVLGVMGAIILPKLIEPYRATNTVNNQIDFFRARLADPDEKIKELEKASEQKQNDIKELEFLAYAYAKEIKTADGKINSTRLNQAIETYKKILVINPDHVPSLNNLANINFTVGHVNEAISYWEKAVQVKPDFIDAHLNLGKAYYTQGKLKKAADHFQAVLKIDPENAEAIVYLKRMVE